MTQAIDSSSVNSRHSTATPKLLHADRNGHVEFCSLLLLFTQRHHEPLHLLLEGLAVALLRLGAHVAARREHVAVLAHLLHRRAHAEAGHIGVRASILLT